MGKTKMVSLRGLSRELGVTKRAVEQAIEYGRITPDKTEKHGSVIRYFFDVVKAKLDWENNTDQSQKHAPTRREMGLGPQPWHGEGTKGQERETKNKELTNFNEIRTERERVNLEIERIELEKLEGSIVDVELAKELLFKLSNTVSQSILAVCDRVAPIVAAESDTKKVRDIIKGELQNALSAFADGEVSFVQQE